MTSSARESSWSDGEPIMFFRFVRGTRAWYYCSSDRNETLNGNTYLSVPISRGGAGDSAERAQLDIDITLPASLSVAANWRPYPPSSPVAVTIWVRHVGEVDTLADWTGRVIGAEFRGAELMLRCAPTIARSRLGSQRVWQRNCGLVLYECGVDRAAHALPATLTAVSGLTLTAAEFGTLPDGRLAGGYLEWTEPDGLVEFRTIQSHAGTDIVVDYGAAALAVGLAATVYPGCAHTWADCDYFANRANYGGDLWIPVDDDPYSGDPVW